MKTITKSQYYALVGLKALATEYDKKMNDLQKYVAEIIGENNVGIGGGWSGELVFSSRGLDDTLRCANIVVEEDTDE